MLFSEPRFTFAVNDTSYLITFAIMTFTAVFTSTLTAQMKRSARQAMEREQDMQALRTLTADLRRKIEKNPAKPRYILTEIGVGYRLAEERE